MEENKVICIKNRHVAVKGINQVIREIKINRLVLMLILIIQCVGFCVVCSHFQNETKKPVKNQHEINLNDYNFSYQVPKVALEVIE